jgi:hypothetical protein
VTEKQELTREFKNDRGLVVSGCWLRYNRTWCDFKVFEACEWTLGDEVIGWTSPNQHPAATDMVKSEPIITGHVKWDGCIEFAIDGHWCDAAESVRDLTSWLQQTLSAAHAAMKACPDSHIDWEPVPTGAQAASLTASDTSNPPATAPAGQPGR